MRPETHFRATPLRAFSRLAAFSMVELLMVLAIIAFLASLVLPTAHRTKVQARKQQARIQLAQIVAALSAYRSAYDRFPASADTIEAAVIPKEDMTYGGVIEETQTWLAGPCYYTDNSELMSGLLDLEYFGDGTPSLNYRHQQNPGQIRFLEATQRGGTNAAAGVGLDSIYRDPWGSPYIITIDLNGDGRVRDVMYRKPIVSQDPQNPERGLCGMVKGSDASGNVVFEAPGTVLAWSPGPDRHLSTIQSANQGVNRDNLLSNGP